MPGCTVSQCRNSSNKGFKMFRFPTDPRRRSAWIFLCGRNRNWQPTQNTSICEIHFDASQFELHRMDGAKRLKPNAVPKLFGRSVTGGVVHTTRSVKSSSITCQSSHSQESCLESIVSTDTEVIQADENLDNDIKPSGADHSYTKDQLRLEAIANMIRTVENRTTQCEYKIEVLEKKIVVPKPISSLKKSTTPRPKIQCSICRNPVLKCARNSQKKALQNISKELLKKRLDRLSLNGEERLLFGENNDVYLCLRCTQLLNSLDRIEAEATMVNYAITNTIRRKNGILLEPDQFVLNDIWDKISSSSSFSDLSTVPIQSDQHGRDNNLTLLAAKPNTAKGSAGTSCLQNVSIQRPSVHINSSHDDFHLEKLICRICKFETPFQSLLIYHLRQHMEVTRTCDFCCTTLLDTAEHNLNTGQPGAINLPQ